MDQTPTEAPKTAADQAAEARFEAITRPSMTEGRNLDPKGMTTDPVITTPTTATESKTLEVLNETPKPDSTVQITEAILKRTYGKCVTKGLKDFVGEIANVDSYEDEVSDEFQEFDYLVHAKRIGLLTRQEMLLNIAAFALAAAASIEAHLESEYEKRKKASLPKRTIGEAVHEQINRILPGPGSGKVSQHLTLNSTVFIDGTNYEIKRAPLTWDGVMFSGPHGPGGVLKFYTKNEAVMNDLVIPKGKPVDGTHIFGQFVYKDVWYNVISPNASWCERSMAIEYTNPQVPTLTHRYGIDFALQQKYIELTFVPPPTKLSTERKLFITGGAMYEIKEPEVTFEAFNSMICHKVNLVEARYTIAGAIGAGLISWVKEVKSGIPERPFV